MLPITFSTNNNDGSSITELEEVTMHENDEETEGVVFPFRETEGKMIPITLTTTNDEGEVEKDMMQESDDQSKEETEGEMIPITLTTTNDEGEAEKDTMQESDDQAKEETERQGQKRKLRRSTEDYDNLTTTPGMSLSELHSNLKSKKQKKETVETLEPKLRALLEELLDKAGYDFVKLIGYGSFGYVIKVINRNRINLEKPEEKFYTVIKVILIKTMDKSSLPLREKVINRDFLNSYSNLIIYDMIILSSECVAIEMEYCQRGSLKSLISNPLNQSEGVYVDLLFDLCNDLIELHQRNLIHRDIKPDNILIRDDINGNELSTERLNNLRLWKMKFNTIRRRDSALPISIADFGLTEYLEEIKNVAGSLKYMAPEIKGGNIENYSTKVDTYALGETFMELCENTKHINKKLFLEMMSEQRENRPEIKNLKNRIHEIMNIQKDRVMMFHLYDRQLLVEVTDNNMFKISHNNFHIVDSPTLSTSQHENGLIFISNPTKSRIEIIGEYPKEWKLGKRNIHSSNETYHYYPVDNSAFLKGICVFGDYLFISGFWLSWYHLPSGCYGSFSMTAEFLCPQLMSRGKNNLVVINFGQYMLVSIENDNISYRIYDTCHELNNLKYFNITNDGLYESIQEISPNGFLIEKIPQFWIEEKPDQNPNMSFGTTITNDTMENKIEFKINDLNIEKVEPILKDLYHSFDLIKKTNTSLIFKVLKNSEDVICVKVYPIHIGLKLAHHEINRYSAKFFDDFFLVESKYYEQGSLFENMNRINIGHLSFIYKQLTETMFNNAYNLNFENIMVIDISKEFIECEINPFYITKHTNPKKCRELVGKLMCQLIFLYYGIEWSKELTIDEIEPLLTIPPNGKTALLKLLNNEEQVDTIRQGDFTMEDLDYFDTEFELTFKLPNGKKINYGNNLLVDDLIKEIQNCDNLFIQDITSYQTISNELGNLSTSFELGTINSNGNVIVTSRGDGYFQIYTKSANNGWNFVCEESWNFGHEDSVLKCLKFIGDQLFFFGTWNVRASRNGGLSEFTLTHLVRRRVKLYIPKRI